MFCSENAASIHRSLYRFYTPHLLHLPTFLEHANYTVSYGWSALWLVVLTETILFFSSSFSFSVLNNCLTRFLSSEFWYANIYLKLVTYCYFVSFCQNSVWNIDCVCVTSYSDTAKNRSRMQVTRSWMEILWEKITKFTMLLNFLCC
jgi:hypothetical protein